MNFNGIDNSKKENIEKLWSRIFKKPQSSFEINFAKSNNFKVSKEGDKLTVSYTCDSELYRSLLLCTQLIDEGKDGEINELRQFDTSGVMLDMSRAAVMKVERIKEYIEYMALCGLNMLMLYTEDTYDLEGYEYFGYMRGKYTKKELKEIDAYALKYGIELIPCIQTLAHLEQYIRWQEGKNLSDTNTVLLIGEPKVYEFIEKMIATVAECFTTKRVHIGMDEAMDMGAGTYLKKNGYKDPAILFCEHLDKVKKITDKYNLKPMIWNDMYFRNSSEKSLYYDPSIVIKSEVKAMVPDNVQLVYWDYYHKDENLYDAMIKNSLDLSSNVAFAGGIWLWRGFIPDYKLTLSTTNAALKSCKKNGVKDVFATVWGDDGAETDHLFSLVGCLLYGEHTYNNEFDYDLWKKRTDILFGANVDDFMAMYDVLYPTAEEDADSGYEKVGIKQIIYNDLLCGLVDHDIPSLELEPKYKDLYTKYEALSKIDGYYKRHYEYVALICKLVTKKMEIMNKMKKGYFEKENSLLSETKDILIPQLEECYYNLKDAHYMLWHSNSKPFGYEVVDGRYGFSIGRLRTVRMRLESYINGEIDSLPELEEKRLTFNRQSLAHFSHKNIVTAYIR